MEQETNILDKIYKMCRKTHPSPAWMGCNAQRFLTL